MKKKKRKNYLIILIMLLLSLLILIFISYRKQNSWIDSILSKKYEIYSLDCDGTTNILDKETLKEIKKNWKNLSNNGPFLGDLNTCYKKIIIDYNNDIAVIEIIDNSSLIIKESNNTDYYTYYTNAKELINNLNKYFS